MDTRDRVAVGMSRGVDSAVTALLLKEQGREVVGVFMKNWDETDDDGACSAAEDYNDVRRVCDQIDIPYYSVNFQDEYWQRVFKYFLSEYEAGRTPNPDVLCNKEIKFDAFLNFCMDMGAASLATGHYAQIDRREDGAHLLKGADPGKDQSYFLCMLNKAQIERAEFPVGGMLKSEVRDIARKHGLKVAEKKDSTGICFIGERKFRDFLRRYMPARPGVIRTLSGEKVGTHIGLMYYTLGQRRGLDIGGCGTGERWFVAKKDLETNTLYVVQGDAPELYSTELLTGKFNFISTEYTGEFDCCAKVRYRQPDQRARAFVEDGRIRLKFEKPQRAVTPGQYAVLYIGDECIGGGVIDEVIGAV